MKGAVIYLLFFFVIGSQVSVFWEDGRCFGSDQYHCQRLPWNPQYRRVQVVGIKCTFPPASFRSGHTRRQVAATIPFVWHARFNEKLLSLRQNFVGRKKSHKLKLVWTYVVYKAFKYVYFTDNHESIMISYHGKITSYFKNFRRLGSAILDS